LTDGDGRGRGAGPDPWRARAALLTAVLIWGSTYVVIKGALDAIGPLTLAFARFAVVVPLLVPLAVRAGLRLDHLRQRSMWVFGATGVTAYFGLQNLGIALTTAGSAALITAAIPGATAVLAFVVLGERPSMLRWVGIGLSTAGVALLVGSGLELGRWQVVAGNLLVAASAVAWAAYTVQGRRLGDGHPPIVSTTAGFLTGMVLLVPLAAAEIGIAGWPAVTRSSLGAVVYLGVLGSGLAIVLWNSGVRRVEASAAGAFTNVVPVLGLVFAVWLGEPLTAMQVVGGVIAGIGVVLTQCGARAATPSDRRGQPAGIGSTAP